MSRIERIEHTVITRPIEKGWYDQFLTALNNNPHLRNGFVFEDSLLKSDGTYGVAHEYALHLACKYNQYEMVKELLKGTTVLNTFDLNGAPIHHASYFADSRVLKLILDQPGVEVNTLDTAGRTPLMIACIKNHLEKIQTLLEDPRVIRDIEGRGGKAGNFFLQHYKNLRAIPPTERDATVVDIVVKFFPDYFV